MVLASGSFAMRALFLDTQLVYLLLPFALCAYYLIVWIIVGKNLPQGVIVPRYEPPEGMSPAAVRYLLMGSTDRRSVAAVLIHLAARKLISIQPENGDYRITVLCEQPPKDIPAEEAAAMRALVEVQSFVDPASIGSKSFLLKPAQNQHISLIGSVISGSMNSKVEKTYFIRNVQYSAPAFLISIAVALGTAAHFENYRNGVFFLSLWFLFCSLIIGVILAMSVVPILRDAFRGRIGTGNVGSALIPLLMFLGALGFVDWRIGKDSTPAFAGSLVAIMVINIGFAISLKRITPLGRQRLDEILGFRQFLATVELEWSLY